jgi:2-dehydro-3-deoxygluconokinase
MVVGSVGERRDMSLDVLCIGESMVSLAPRRSVRLKDATSLSVHVAGAESNVAVTVAALGGSAAWLSRVGRDPFGELVVDAVRSAGVDVSGVGRCDGLPTGVMVKDPGASGTAVHYYRTGSAAASMGAEMLADVVGLQPRVVHVSGVTPALSPSCLELVSQLIENRPIGGAIISFDVNYRPALWPRDDAAQTLLALAQASDIVFVGVDEAEQLWQVDSPEAARDLLGGASRLVVKNGADDASEFGSGTRVSVPAPSVDVVEPVGAGDAFAAGWLVGMLRELPPRQRLRLGHLCAAHAMLRADDHSRLPAPNDLAGLLRASDATWSLLRFEAEPLASDE